MAKELSYYIDLMKRYRQDYTALTKAGATSAAREKSIQIKRLRYNMLADGYSLNEIYEMEKAAKIAIDGSISTDWENGIRVSLTETYLIQQFINLKNAHRYASETERKKIEEQIKVLRMRIHAIGYDAYAFEDLAQEIWLGRPMTKEERDVQYQLVKNAISAYNKLDQNGKEALKALFDPKTGTIPGFAGSPNATSTALDNFPANPKWASSESTGKIKKSSQIFKDHQSHVFSGSDMVVFFAFPGHRPIEIGVASTISYTTYREKKQLRTLGRISAKGIVKGTRTISGRIILTVIREHIVEQLRKEIPYLRDIKTLLMDELPPFDILISFGNEYGAAAGLVIQGVTTVDEQKTLSIEDLFTENLFTYLARAIEPMRDMNSTMLEEPYDPLQWFTTSFRTPGSETIGTFKPKETQIYHDAQLLVSTSPFYGSVAGWDSSLYNALTIDGDYIGVTGNGSIVTTTTPVQSSTPSSSTGSNLKSVMIQAVIFKDGSTQPLTNGYMTVYKKQAGGSYQIVNSYNMKGYPIKEVEQYMKTYPMVKSQNQNFPISRDGLVYGVLFRNFFKIGDQIKVTIKQNGYKTTSQEFTISSVQNGYAVLMSQAAPDTPNYPSEFHYVEFIKAVPDNGASKTKHNGVYILTYGLLGDSIDPVSSNYGSKKFSLKEYTTHLSSIPAYLDFYTKDQNGHLIPQADVYWTWRLDLSRWRDLHASERVLGTKSNIPFHKYQTDEQLKHAVVDETYSNSLQLSRGYADYYDKSYPPYAINHLHFSGYYKETSSLGGQVRIPLAECTFFLSVKMSDGKRYKVLWDDLPEFAVLICDIFREHSGKKSLCARVCISSPRTAIKWDHLVFQKVRKDIDNKAPRYGIK